jgi:hypothetical protein
MTSFFLEREDSEISSEHVVGDLRDDLHDMGGESTLDSLLLGLNQGQSSEACRGGAQD